VFEDQANIPKCRMMKVESESQARERGRLREERKRRSRTRNGLMIIGAPASTCHLIAIRTQGLFASRPKNTAYVQHEDHLGYATMLGHKVCSYQLLSILYHYSWLPRRLSRSDPHTPQPPSSRQNRPSCHSSRYLCPQSPRGHLLAAVQYGQPPEHRIMQDVPFSSMPSLSPSVCSRMQADFLARKPYHWLGRPERVLQRKRDKCLRQRM